MICKLSKVLTMFWQVVSKMRVCAMVGIVAAQPCFAAVLLTTTSAGPNQTFSFPVQAHATSSQGGTLYIGALPTATNTQNFALAFTQRGATIFEPLAMEKVQINNTSGIDPVFNKGISLLTVIPVPGISDNPVVVTADNPTNAYLFENISHPEKISILSVEGVKDAAGAVTAGIVAIEQYTIRLATIANVSSMSGAFGAVKPNAGSFGAVGSGIALLQLTVSKVEQDGPDNKKIEKTVYSFTQLDAQPGSISTVARASALNISSPSVAINNNVAAITDIVDMHWDAKLRRLYVGLQLTVGATAGDGGRALVVGYLDAMGKINFLPFAPDAVFTANNEIIGTGTANAQVAIQKVRTMHTSTQLDYVVVLGGNGNAAATAHTVYALPITNQMNQVGVITNNATHGVLADKNATPVTLFSGSHYNNPSFFTMREIQDPATTTADIFTTDATDANSPAHVGRGPLPAGNIADMVVARDAVFVSVITPDVNQLPGIFYSSAYFDDLGKIKGWTPWQRTGGTTLGVYGLAFDEIDGTIMFMSGSTPDTVQKVYRTQWGTGDEASLQFLLALLAAEFSPAAGGIQGLFDFQMGVNPIAPTPGLRDIAVQIATGLQKIMLTQTGQLINGALIPSGGDFVANPQRFTDGIISPAANAKALIVSGGALDQLGAIIAADIGVANNNGWLFVGGVGGLAVLAEANGDGWDTTTGLSNNFAGLVDGMAFNIIGSYSFVRKLIADNGFLYVLTDMRLDRINLALSNFATGQLSVTTLATTHDPDLNSYGAFLDLVVTNKFALLATNEGLLRVGNGKNVSTAANVADVAWTPVMLNQGIVPITQLTTVTPTGRPQDLGAQEGGNVYVSNAYIGYNQGQVNRLSIANVAAAPIDNNTVTQLPDILIQNMPGPLSAMFEYFDVYATDGSLYLYGCSQDLTRPLFVKTVQSNNRPLRNAPIALNGAGASMLNDILRNSASGSWLVSGDLIRTNE